MGRAGPGRARSVENRGRDHVRRGLGNAAAERLADSVSRAGAHASASAAGAMAFRDQSRALHAVARCARRGPARRRAAPRDAARIHRRCGARAERPCDALDAGAHRRWQRRAFRSVAPALAGAWPRRRGRDGGLRGGACASQTGRRRRRARPRHRPLVPRIGLDRAGLDARAGVAAARIRSDMAQSSSRASRSPSRSWSPCPWSRPGPGRSTRDRPTSFRSGGGSRVRRRSHPGSR